MPIEHVLAVVPVRDLEISRAWYERLFSRPEDNRPMETLVEWRATPNGWVQVWHDHERAGQGLLNLAVDDLDAQVAELSERGLEPGAIQEASEGVRLSAIEDPDGNRVTFIGGFRVVY